MTRIALWAIVALAVLGSSGMAFAHEYRAPQETVVLVEEWNGYQRLTVERRVTAHFDVPAGRYYFVYGGYSYWL